MKSRFHQVNLRIYIRNTQNAYSKAIIIEDIEFQCHMLDYET